MKQVEKVLFYLRAQKIQYEKGGVDVSQLSSGLVKIFKMLADADLKLDEPLFVIRGQDVAAADAIDKYREAAAFRGAGVDFQQAVWQRAREFREWQRLNAKFVKIPH